MSKLRVCTVAAALAACGPKRAEDPMPPKPTPCVPANQPATAAEVEQHLTLAVQPFGDRVNVEEMEFSSCWLLQHGDAAYPAVVARVREGKEAGYIELLGRFDRAASTALLAELLGGDGPGPQQAAALALARSSDAAAGAALVAAAGDARATVASAALQGLRDRGDAALCPAVVARVTDADARLRFDAVEAAGILGCLDAAALKAIARDDPDADVRAVAAELAGKRPRR